MRVRALLDSPGRNSFGMVGFIAEMSDQKLRSIGLSGRLNRQEISTFHFTQLVHDGHALDVSSVNVSIDDDLESPAAGWLGTGFVETLAHVAGPDHGAPLDRFIIPDRGTFWIQSTQELYAHLRNWTEAAARMAILRRDTSLADLMEWALPDAPETGAAVWYTSSPEARERHIAWQLRIDPSRNRSELIAKYDRIIHSVIDHGI